jgi:cytochrome c peroxidase
MLGVWNTAPYMHDGSAATLDDVLNFTPHVGSLTTQEKTDLKNYPPADRRHEP